MNETYDWGYKNGYAAAIADLTKALSMRGDMCEPCLSALFSACKDLSRGSR